MGTLLTGATKDPEKNKLGEKGIHLTAKQKAAKEKAAAEAAEDEEVGLRVAIEDGLKSNNG